MCYCEQATCKLMCTHSFCKSCIKTWYQKSEEPTCPMCRHNIYFKGFHKVLSKWENEKIDKRNEDAFNSAFESIFDMESEDEYTSSETDSNIDEDSDSDSDSEYETWDSLWETPNENENEIKFLPTIPPVIVPNDFYSRFILEEIIELQKIYKKSIEAGIDFEYYLENMDYILFETPNSFITWDDVFPHFKNLFVSNHIVRNKRRTGSRVPSKCDNYFTIILFIEC